MSHIPAFGPDGLLPPGDYDATFAQLKQSILVKGPGQSIAPNWDEPWRRGLIDNLEILVDQLWQVGIEDIFVDGSFAEDKDHPNDIDGYFNCEQNFLLSGNLVRLLNLLDPYKVWTWDHRTRRPHKGFAKKQLPMWHQYRVELYPHVPGLFTGIKDRHGNELEFPSAFRQSRQNGNARGIIRIL